MRGEVGKQEGRKKETTCYLWYLKNNLNSSFRHIAAHWHCLVICFIYYIKNHMLYALCAIYDMCIYR